MDFENFKMEWEITQENLTLSGVGHNIPTTLLLAPTLIFNRVYTIFSVFFV